MARRGFRRHHPSFLTSRITACIASRCDFNACLPLASTTYQVTDLRFWNSLRTVAYPLSSSFRK